MTALGQLSLFTKRKAARLPPALEFATHCMVADVLRISCSPGWIWFHVPNGELRNKAVAGKLKRMGVKVGVSDFLLISPGDARLHALELKRKGEKPNDDQKEFMKQVSHAGGSSAWADNFDKAIEILKFWGAVRVSL